MTETIKLIETDGIQAGITDFSQLQNEEFNPERARMLARRQELISRYTEKVRKSTDDEQVSNDLIEAAESSVDILLDLVSLKELRQKRIRQIEGEDIEKNYEYYTAIGMDTDFWTSPEYLEYCKKKMPEVYNPDANQVANFVGSFLEKTGDEMTLFALGCAAKDIANGKVLEGISRTVRIISSELVLNIPEELNVKLAEDSTGIVASDKNLSGADAFYHEPSKTVYIKRPLEYFKDELGPIETVALFAHETFHAFQHCIEKNGNDIQKSIQYSQNWNNYIPLSVDIESYARQLVEVEAYVFQMGIIRQLSNTKRG